MHPIDSFDPLAPREDPSAAQQSSKTVNAEAIRPDPTTESALHAPPADLFTFSPFGSLPTTSTKQDMRKPLEHLNGMTNSTSFGGASLFGAGNTLGAPMMHTFNSNDMLESDRPSSNHLMSNGRLSPQSNHDECRQNPSVNHGRSSPNIHHSQGPAMDNLGGKSPNGYGQGRKSPICKENGHISPMVSGPMKVQEEGRKSIDDSWVSLGWSDLQASGETLPTDNEPSHPLASIPEVESKPPASLSFLSAEPTSMNMSKSPASLERDHPKSPGNAPLKGLSGSPMRQDKPETMREKSPTRFAPMETKSMTPQKETAMPILPPTIMQTPTTKAIEESSKATPKEKTPAAVPKTTPKEQTPKSTGSPVTPRSSGRQRKSVNRLSPTPQERVESKTIEIPTGSGAKLGDISHGTIVGKSSNGYAHLSSCQGIGQAQVRLSGNIDASSGNFWTTRRGF